MNQIHGSDTRTAPPATFDDAGRRATRDRHVEDPGSSQAPTARRVRPSRRLAVLVGAVLIAAFATGCFPTGPVEAWVPDFDGDGKISNDEVEFQKALIINEAVAAVETQRRRVQNHPFLTCVRRHESDHGPAPYIGGYGAKNPRSSASGAYQFLDSTWRNVAPRAGHPGYSSARYAPWWVQDAVAMYVVNTGGKSAWRGTGC